MARYVEEKLDGGAAGGMLRIGLACGETKLLPEMSLQTVRTFFWKNGGDMILTYDEARRHPPAAR